MRMLLPRSVRSCVGLMNNFLVDDFGLQAKGSSTLFITFAGMAGILKTLASVKQKIGIETRPFEFVHSLIKRGLADGKLGRRFDSRELAYGFYGQINFYSMAYLIMPDRKLNRSTAERIVNLFLIGAAAKKGKALPNS